MQGAPACQILGIVALNVLLHNQAVLLSVRFRTRGSVLLPVGAKCRILWPAAALQQTAEPLCKECSRQIHGRWVRTCLWTTLHLIIAFCILA